MRFVSLFGLFSLIVYGEMLIIALKLLPLWLTISARLPEGGPFVRGLVLLVAAL